MARVAASASKTSNDATAMRRTLQELIAASFPGATLVAVRPFGVDTPHDDATTKAIGYGRPLRLDLLDEAGQARTVVLHFATPNAFGHDRRADRAAEMLLAFDTFNDIPRHVQALDVGTIARDGRLMSLREAGELWLLTSYAEGHVYADELRRIEKDGRSDARDLAHARTLARYLAELHAGPVEAGPASYTRACRDLVGSGEGIFGIIDGYPADCAGAAPERLMALEQACVRERWRLRTKVQRRARIHGDFHPFNILFDDPAAAEPTHPPEQDARGLCLLDTSRGSVGDPADDVTCLAINYVFFALGAPGSWREGFAPLWRAFFDTYFERRSDSELLEVAPAYLAWRVLVVANPAWYPDATAQTRDKILSLAERSLAAGRLDPAFAEELFR